MLDLINGLAALVGDRFEPIPHEQRTGNMITAPDFWGTQPPKTLRMSWVGCVTMTAAACAISLTEAMLMAFLNS